MISIRYAAIVLLAGLCAAGCHQKAASDAPETPPQTQAQIQSQMDAVQNAPGGSPAVKEGTLKMLQSAKTQAPAAGSQAPAHP